MARGRGVIIKIVLILNQSLRGTRYVLDPKAPNRCNSNSISMKKKRCFRQMVLFWRYANRVKQVLHAVQPRHAGISAPSSAHTLDKPTPKLSGWGASPPWKERTLRSGSKINYVNFQQKVSTKHYSMSQAFTAIRSQF